MLLLACAELPQQRRGVPPWTLLVLLVLLLVLLLLWMVLCRTLCIRTGSLVYA